MSSVIWTDEAHKDLPLDNYDLDDWEPTQTDNQNVIYVMRGGGVTTVSNDCWLHLQ